MLAALSRKHVAIGPAWERLGVRPAGFTGHEACQCGFLGFSKLLGR